MSVSFGNVFRSIFSGSGMQRTTPQIPQALLDTAAAQRAAHPKPVRYDGRDMPFGNTGRHFLPPGGVTAWVSKQTARPDAGNAAVAAENASLHLLTYCYGTHKPMEAWVQDPPADGKLKMKMAISPSSHAGSTPAQKKANYKKFALENTYNLEIRFPDGKVERQKFKVNGKTPEYSTVSPEFEIDLQKYAGKDVIINGWADGSAGVAGYNEKRQTVLHCPD